jgi:HIUase/Transthyretin family
MSEFKDGERTSWSIKFEVGPWYEQRNVESFWPEVEVKFYVKKGERHYHVPVLVGPWTYTTYRGSWWLYHTVNKRSVAAETNDGHEYLAIPYTRIRWAILAFHDLYSLFSMHSILYIGSCLAP